MYIYIYIVESKSITINLQVIKLYSVETFSLQRFIAPATQSCKIPKKVLYKKSY